MPVEIIEGKSLNRVQDVRLYRIGASQGLPLLVDDVVNMEVDCGDSTVKLRGLHSKV